MSPSFSSPVHVETRIANPSKEKRTPGSMPVIPPHGGALVNPFVGPGRARELKRASREWLSWELTPRQLCDLELLLNGGFSPLHTFLGRADYEAVCSSMRLADGTLWPVPINLDLPDELAKQIRPATTLALRDPEGAMLAALEVEELWKPDRPAEAEQVFGTSNSEHPGVRYLIEQSHPWYASGKLEGLELPAHYDFRGLRPTPAELRDEFARLGWARVVAFQTRNPMHRAHYELTRRAALEVEGKLLIHPSVGMTKPGDVDHYTRVRCYQAILAHYPRDTARLALLPLAMRMGGPREALWHAIIRKNYGCTHLIVGRDHAGPGKDSQGRAFYGHYDAQELLASHRQELGIQAIPFKMMTYMPHLDSYVPEDELPRGARPLNISGTELRERLAQGLEIPAWFTFPEVARELRRRYAPRLRQGFAIFFTGLSGAGKSTLARILLAKLLEMGDRAVTLLDGDLVRKHLSSELGFSREHRDINIRRIGFVAAEIAKNGGIAICAPIAPYDAVRKEVRAMVEACGGFVLVHVATPLPVCEQRDRKGLYAKARAGSLSQFTGISDPYEAPQDAELVLDTTHVAPEASAERMIGYLEKQGFLPAPAEVAEKSVAVASD